MISDARGGHVSPGIYTEEKDVTYSVKSLGITSLGLVGETLKGPAFQNIEINNWSDFVDYFGGTSTETFKGTGALKYELPYIAKSYLQESKRLNVVRVLGLSGYDAGKAWIVSTSKTDAPVAILRSKMTYGEVSSACTATENEKASALVSNIEYTAYTPAQYTSNCTAVSDDTSANISANDANALFGIKVTLTAGGTLIYNVSLNPDDNDYIYNVISSNPSTGETPIYIEAVYENSWNGNKITDISAVENYNDFNEGFRCALTPWIVSNISATKTGTTLTASMKKLFRFYTISDGDEANFQVKVSIQNIDPEKGTFNVWVRDYNDTDNSPVVLEKFSKCSLVEGDDSYIAFKIGSIDGGYESKSKYIAVEMADGDFSNYVPAGFLGYPMPTYGRTSKFNMSYNTLYNNTIKAKRQYFGLNSNVIDSDVLKYKGVNAYSSAATFTDGFHLDSILSSDMKDKYTPYVDGYSGYTFTAVNSVQTGNSYNAIPRVINAPYMRTTMYEDINLRKFTVYFYGGFDGWDINAEQRTNTNEYRSTTYKVTDNSRYQYWNGDTSSAPDLKLDPATATTADYYAYLGGYKIFSNPQDIEINLFATPGINWYDHTLLFEDALDVIVDTEDGRGGDALYVVDSPILDDEISYDEIPQAISDKEIDTSYACTYYPGVMYFDSTNSKYVNISVTKDVVRNMAATDNNSYPWFAPAGIERGSVSCIKALHKTTLAEEDDLYEAAVNPVKSFAQEGVKIWGNKTLYSKDSPLNRINVRRLMIRVKKLVKDAALSLIFEQYDESLEQQFKSLVEPILSEVKSNRGIYDYRVITECTAETRDQHILPAKILIKPTPALEYISISFVVYPESVEFDEN